MVDCPASHVGFQVGLSASDDDFSDTYLSNCLNGQKILPKKWLFFLLSTLWKTCHFEKDPQNETSLPSKYLCPKSSPPKCTPEADADTHASWLGIINGHSICHGQMHPHWGWQKCPNLSISLTWIRRKTHGKSLHPDTSQKPSGHERKMPWKKTGGKFDHLDFEHVDIETPMKSTTLCLPTNYTVNLNRMSSTINVCFLWYSEWDIFWCIYILIIFYLNTSVSEIILN